MSRRNWHGGRGHRGAPHWAHSAVPQPPHRRRDAGHPRSRGLGSAYAAYDNYNKRGPELVHHYRVCGEEVWARAMQQHNGCQTIQAVEMWPTPSMSQTVSMEMKPTIDTFLPMWAWAPQMQMMDVPPVSPTVSQSVNDILVAMAQVQTMAPVEVAERLKAAAAAVEVYED
mmetsp:Transcript_23092/g.40815  ORF Transcript_23092/g.40815 Transcript_23092/m.40815 type:complete len:170 (+) Transcript_23092:64-573(+)